MCLVGACGCGRGVLEVGGGGSVEIAVLKPHFKSTLHYSLHEEGCVAGISSHVKGQTVRFISRNHQHVMARIQCVILSRFYGTRHC